MPLLVLVIKITKNTNNLLKNHGHGLLGGKEMYIKEYKDKKTNKTLFMFQGYLGVDQATGKRIRVTRTGFKSSKECELEYFKLKIEYEEGNYNTKPEKYKYQEVYDLWMEQYKNTVKESTLNKTLTIFKTHILPIFKDYYIDMIKVRHCQEAVNKWYKTLKNYRVINNYCGLVFKYAIKLGIIKDNPTTLVTMPVRKESIEEESIENFYSKEEIIDFLDKVKTYDNKKWFTMFRTLAFTGCRKGELLALKWSDINFKENTISINKTLTRGLKNKLIVQPPKTKKSKRVLPMDVKTMNILQEWKTQQAKDMFKLGFNTLSKDQLVFSNAKNEFICPQKIGQKIDSICNKFKLRVITPHGFRHTHCSLLLESGTPIKEVQNRLGHSDIQTTMNIYAHVTKRREEETILKFAQFMSI